MHIAPIKSGVFAPVVLLTRMKSGHPRDINFNNPGLVLTIKAIITIIRRLINNFMCPPGLYVFITPGRQNKCDPRAPLNEHHLFIRINFKRVRSTPFYINGESVVAPRVILKKFVNSDLITKLGDCDTLPLGNRSMRELWTQFWEFRTFSQQTEPITEQNKRNN